MGGGRIASASDMVMKGVVEVAVNLALAALALAVAFMLWRANH